MANASSSSTSQSPFTSNSILQCLLQLRNTSLFCGWRNYRPLLWGNPPWFRSSSSSNGEPFSVCECVFSATIREMVRDNQTGKTCGYGFVNMLGTDLLNCIRALGEREQIMKPCRNKGTKLKRKRSCQRRVLCMSISAITSHGMPKRCVEKLLAFPEVQICFLRNTMVPRRTTGDGLQLYKIPNIFVVMLKIHQ